LAYGFAPWVPDIDLTERRPPAAQSAGTRHIVEEPAMDTEQRVIVELLALKDAPDDALLDQVETIGVTATRYMLFNEADRLQHTDEKTATDCAALVDRIDALIRPA
jgi:hypothetical protein